RPRPWYVHVQTRLRHDATQELHTLPVVIQHQPLGRHFYQPPGMFLAARQPAANRLAERPLELAVLTQDAIEARRRHFEIVRLVHHAFRVEQVPDLPAQPLAVSDADTPRLVDEETEDATAMIAPPLEVDEREPVMPDDRHDHVLNPRELLVVHRRNPRPVTKVKKWARPTFSGL